LKISTIGFQICCQPRFWRALRNLDGLPHSRAFTWRKLTPASRVTRLGGVPHLACEHNQEKKRDCMKRLVTSPTWGPPSPCEQALSLLRSRYLGRHATLLRCVTTQITAAETTLKLRLFCMMKYMHQYRQKR